MKAKLDLLFLGVIGLIIADTIGRSYSHNYEFEWTHYLGFAAWVSTLLTRFLTNRSGRYAVGILLILGTLGLFNFTVGTTITMLSFGPLIVAFNPYTAIVLIAYYFVNIRSVNTIVSTLFKGSAQEQQNKRQRSIEFYLHKFENYSAAEFETVLKNFDQYPDEAQEALKEICRMRGISSR